MNIHDLQKNTLHHAYLINGSNADFSAIETSLETLFDVSFVGNPDVFKSIHTAFTVDIARSIVRFASGAAFIVGNPKIVLFSFTTITRESQNILLKTLEEPPKDTYIFIVTPNTDMLLPTVLSRCLQLDISTQKGEQEMSTESQKFITATTAERLKMIEKINKGKDKSENKAIFLKILSDLELYSTKHTEVKDWHMKVTAVLQAQKYMHDKGAMSKMLMESVALIF